MTPLTTELAFLAGLATAGLGSAVVLLWLHRRYTSRLRFEQAVAKGLSMVVESYREQLAEAKPILARREARRAREAQKRAEKVAAHCAEIRASIEATEHNDNIRQFIGDAA